MSEDRKGDLDSSIGRDSVFDWGFSRESLTLGSLSGSLTLGTLGRRGSGKEGASSQATRKKVIDKQESTASSGPSSRYDPKAMSRIVDITDLVSDDHDDETDSDMEDDVYRQASSQARIAGRMGMGGSKGGYGKVMCRQALVLVAVAALIVGAAMAIGYAILDGKEGTNSSRPTRLGGGGEGARQQQASRGQELLELAERVTVACSESALDADAAECRDLCKDATCCFEEDEYSCEDDEDVDCAVHAGCLALFEGVPTDGAEEEEE